MQTLEWSSAQQLCLRSLAQAANGAFRRTFESNQKDYCLSIRGPDMDSTSQLLQHPFLPSAPPDMHATCQSLNY